MIAFRFDKVCKCVFEVNQSPATLPSFHNLHDKDGFYIVLYESPKCSQCATEYEATITSINQEESDKYNTSGG